MPKYSVEFSEVLFYEVHVTADDEEEAKDIAMDQYLPDYVVDGYVQDGSWTITAIKPDPQPPSIEE